jgi:hypothetical protein
MMQGNDGESADKEKTQILVKSEKVHSKWELQGPAPKAGMALVRSVAVDEGLEKHLKPHQKEGVEFLWRHAFF